mgnify:FL=1
MKKSISFTWEVRSTVPIIVLWNYKGEKIHSFSAHNPPKSAAKSLLGNNKRYLKEEAKKFHGQHGIRATNVVKVARGIVYNEVYKQFPEWYRLCRTTSWTPMGQRFEYLETEELLQQCRKDGIANIIPIVAYFKKSPQELKKALGETTWKKLCKNTYSRNRLLFLRSDARLTPVEWNAVPSTILKSRTHFTPEVYSWLIHTQDIPLKSYSKDYNIQREAGIYIDTQRMCIGAGETFNPNWSKRRMKEEHDRLSRMQQEIANRRQAECNAEYAKLLKVDFRELHKGLEVMEFDSGVVAVPLVNMQQVQEEGSKMHHCVGSYARMCAEGEYLVWHLTKGSVETTLGITAQHENYIIAMSEDKYNLQQHYGFCNAAVEDADLKAAAKSVVKMLNEKNKEKVLDDAANLAVSLDRELEAA